MILSNSYSCLSLNYFLYFQILFLFINYSFIIYYSNPFSISKLWYWSIRIININRSIFSITSNLTFTTKLSFILELIIYPINSWIRGKTYIIVLFVFYPDLCFLYLYLLLYNLYCFSFLLLLILNFLYFNFLNFFNSFLRTFKSL